MPKPNRLSILIPSIPQRFAEMQSLYEKIQDQIDNYNSDAIDVEVIVFIDNKKRTIGQKRNDILTLATGNYVVEIDDDDGIADNFIYRICETIIYNDSPDVITFKQLAIVNKHKSIVNFGINNAIEVFKPNKITKRPVWHCCVIKTKLALQCRFDSTLNWGEDLQFSNEINALAKSEVHLDEVLHIYNHQDTKTASFKE